MSIAIHNLLSKDEHEKILLSIQMAETNTSGEIRLFIEDCCKDDVLDRASYVFGKLNMHKTEARNGVLIYLAFTDKKFAIIGDVGINILVKDNFWNEIKDVMAGHFKKGKFFEGLDQGIHMIGEALKIHFPYKTNDTNELPDDIIFGDENL